MDTLPETCKIACGECQTAYLPHELKLCPYCAFAYFCTANDCIRTAPLGPHHVGVCTIVQKNDAVGIKQRQAREKASLDLVAKLLPLQRTPPSEEVKGALEALWDAASAYKEVTALKCHFDAHAALLPDADRAHLQRVATEITEKYDAQLLTVGKLWKEAGKDARLVNLLPLPPGDAVDTAEAFVAVMKKAYQTHLWDNQATLIPKLDTVVLTAAKFPPPAGTQNPEAAQEQETLEAIAKLQLQPGAPSLITLVLDMVQKVFTPTKAPPPKPAPPAAPAPPPAKMPRAAAAAPKAVPKGATQKEFDEGRNQDMKAPEIATPPDGDDDDDDDDDSSDGESDEKPLIAPAKRKRNANAKGKRKHKTKRAHSTKITINNAGDNSSFVLATCESSVTPAPAPVVRAAPVAGGAAQADLKPAALQKNVGLVAHYMRAWFGIEVSGTEIAAALGLTVGTVAACALKDRTLPSMLPELVQQMHAFKSSGAAQVTDMLTVTGRETALYRPAVHAMYTAATDNRGFCFIPNALQLVGFPPAMAAFPTQLGYPVAFATGAGILAYTAALGRLGMSTVFTSASLVEHLVSRVVTPDAPLSTGALVGDILDSYRAGDSSDIMAALLEPVVKFAGVPRVGAFARRAFAVWRIGALFVDINTAASAIGLSGVFPHCTLAMEAAFNHAYSIFAMTVLPIIEAATSLVVPAAVAPGVWGTALAYVKSAVAFIPETFLEPFITAAGWGLEIAFAAALVGIWFKRGMKDAVAFLSFGSLAYIIPTHFAGSSFLVHAGLAALVLALPHLVGRSFDVAVAAAKAKQPNNVGVNLEVTTHLTLPGRAMHVVRYAFPIIIWGAAMVNVGNMLGSTLGAAGDTDVPVLDAAPAQKRHHQHQHKPLKPDVLPEVVQKLQARAEEFVFTAGKKVRQFRQVADLLRAEQPAVFALDGAATTDLITRLQTHAISHFDHILGDSPVDAKRAADALHATQFKFVTAFLGYPTEEAIDTMERALVANYHEAVIGKPPPRSVAPPPPPSPGSTATALNTGFWDWTNKTAIPYVVTNQDTILWGLHWFLFTTHAMLDVFQWTLMPSDIIDTPAPIEMKAGAIDPAHVPKTDTDAEQCRQVTRGWCVEYKKNATEPLLGKPEAQGAAAMTGFGPGAPLEPVLGGLEVLYNSRSNESVSNQRVLNHIHTHAHTLHSGSATVADKQSAGIGIVNSVCDVSAGPDSTGTREMVARAETMGCAPPFTKAVQKYYNKEIILASGGGAGAGAAPTPHTHSSFFEYYVKPLFNNPAAAKRSANHFAILMTQIDLEQMTRAQLITVWVQVKAFLAENAKHIAKSAAALAIIAGSLYLTNTLDSVAKALMEMGTGMVTSWTRAKLFTMPMAVVQSVALFFAGDDFVPGHNAHIDLLEMTSFSHRLYAAARHARYGCALMPCFIGADMAAAMAPNELIMLGGVAVATFMAAREVVYQTLPQWPAAWFTPPHIVNGATENNTALISFSKTLAPAQHVLFGMMVSYYAHGDITVSISQALIPMTLIMTGGAWILPQTLQLFWLQLLPICLNMPLKRFMTLVGTLLQQPAAARLRSPADMALPLGVTFAEVLANDPVSIGEHILTAFGQFIRSAQFSLYMDKVFRPLAALSAADPQRVALYAEVSAALGAALPFHDVAQLAVAMVGTVGPVTDTPYSY
jgi:hypothetical protein